MKSIYWRGGILVITMAALVGCGRGTTSSAGMASIAAAAVGGVVAATARKKPKLSLDAAQMGPEQVIINYNVDANVDVPFKRGALLDQIKSGAGQADTSVLDGVSEPAQLDRPRLAELIESTRQARSQ